MLKAFQGLPTAFRESLALHYGSPDAANLASALFSELLPTFLLTHLTHPGLRAFALAAWSALPPGL